MAPAKESANGGNRLNGGVWGVAGAASYPEVSHLAM